MGATGIPVSRPAAGRVVIALAVALATVVVPIGGLPAAEAALLDLPDQTWGVVDRAPSLTTTTPAEVMAIAQIGNTIYAGGQYTTVVRRRTVDPRYTQPFLAAFDATTGDWIDWWRPEVNGQVFALEASADGSRLYVGGEFTEVNGHPGTAGIVALDPASGRIDHTWTPRVENAFADDPAVVRVIRESGGWIYIGGSFSHATGNNPNTRANLWKVGRLSPVDGAPDLSWRPRAIGGSVHGLDHDPVRGRVYLAGFFESINSVTPSDNFAVVNDTDGSNITNLQRFPELTPNQDHNFDVVVNGDYVWVAGTQHLVTMLNASDLSINRRWFTGYEPGFHNGGDFQSLGIAGDAIYATCHCWGVVRELPNWVTTLSQARDIQPLTDEVQGIMGFDLATGDYITGWSPDIYGQIGGWAVHGAGDGCLWAGGDFNRRAVGDQWHNALVRWCDDGGQGAPVGPPLTEQPPPETNPPSVPGSLTASDVGDGTVDLSWTSSSDDTAVVYYRVYRNGMLLRATKGLTLTDLAATPGDSYTVRAVDPYDNESADSAPATPNLAGLLEPVLNAGFDGSDDGFTYSDDVFRSTNQPLYADGRLRREGGQPDGFVMVIVGGMDAADEFNFSGAWEKDFTMPTAGDVEISLMYRLDVRNDLETSEYAEALAAIDGTFLGSGGHLAQIAGGGDTGWTSFTTTVNLSAGTHTLAVGAYQNGKTTIGEFSEISFDAISITPLAPSVGFTSPVAGSDLTGIVPLELRASSLRDASAALDVEVSSDGGNTWTPAAWNPATERFDVSVDVGGRPDGPITLVARVTDTAARVGTGSADYLVNNDGDPSVTITDPANGANVTGIVSIELDANDPNDPAGSLLVEVSTNGATWNTASWNAVRSRYEYTWDTAANGDGPATIEARATDSSPVTVYATPVNVTVISAPGTDYADTVLAAGATVYWRLGESAGNTAVDELGGNDATYLGSPALGASGVIAGTDGAVDFDGVDDWIDVANSVEMNQGGPYGTKTIEMWFNADDVSSRHVLIEQGSVSRGFNIYLDGGRLYAGMYNTTASGGDTPWGPIWLSTPVAANTIYHAVLVLNQPADTLSLYLNGALAGSAAGAGDLYNHSQAAIGSQLGWARYHTGAANGQTAFFDGTLDEIAVYASAMTSGTVATHYAVGTSASTEPSISIVSPSAGASVSGNVTVALNAADPDDPVGSLDVEVRTDGATWTPASWNAGLSRYEYVWDTSINGDGPATIEARVTDMTPTTVTAAPVNVTVFTPPAADYRQTVIDDGATVYWRLGESAGTTVVDEIGGNDATYLGNPALAITGLITDTDTAVGFDGVDDRIDLANSAEINQGGPYTQKTIELWFQAPDATSRQVLVEQGSVTRGLNIYLDGGRLYAGMYNTTTNGGDTPWGPIWLSTPVAVGTTYHVVFALNQPADTLSLYVNGTLVDSASGAGDLNNHGVSAIGGARGWSRYHTGAQQGSINNFNGILDEVAVYATALSPGTVAAHYAAGTS